jgi:hypothetical protein
VSDGGWRVEGGKDAGVGMNAKLIGWIKNPLVGPSYLFIKPLSSQASSLETRPYALGGPPTHGWRMALLQNPQLDARRVVLRPTGFTGKPSTLSLYACTRVFIPRA